MIRRYAMPTIFLLLLLLGTGWVVSTFWGNPWVRLTMEGRVTEHLSNRYPQTRFAVTGTVYDFLNRRYVIHVRTETEPIVGVVVHLSRTGIYSDDYPRQKLKAEMLARLTPVVLAVLPEATVRADALLPDASQYGEGVAYGPEVKGRLIASVEWDLSSSDPEPFVTQAAAVLAALRQSGLRVDGCHFWGQLEDRSLALDLTQAEMAFTKEQLLPLVAKPGKW